MISIEHHFLENLDDDLVTGIYEWGKTIQSVLDILTKPEMHQSCLGDGSTLDMAAAYGKLHIICDRYKNLSLQLPPKSAHDIELLHRDVENIRVQWPQQFEIFASRDIDEYIVMGIVRCYDTRKILLDPSDFQYFLENRDWIELAFIGNGLHLIREDEIAHFRRMDQLIREYVQEVVIPHLKQSSHNILGQFRIPAVSDLFWWRGLD